MIKYDDVSRNKTFREMDLGTHISLKNKYIYFQVSKSASSTVKFYLQSLEIYGTQRKVIDVNNRNLSPHVWPSQLPESQFFNLLNDPAIKKVSFVRNPFSRLLSCYLHRIKELPSSPSVRNIKRFTKNRFDHNLSFDDFINIVCDQKSMEQDSHWRLQTDEIFYNLIDSWDFIGKVENIDNDLHEMLRIVSPTREHSNEALKDFSPSVTNASSKLEKYYNQQLVSRVVERYKLDFLNFGYSKSIVGH
ncbi:sulfotransferase family protein [Vreelandella sp. H-I2]